MPGVICATATDFKLTVLRALRGYPFSSISCAAQFALHCYLFMYTLVLYVVPSCSFMCPLTHLCIILFFLAYIMCAHCACLLSPFILFFKHGMYHDFLIVLLLYEHNNLQMYFSEMGISMQKKSARRL